MRHISSLFYYPVTIGISPERVKGTVSEGMTLGSTREEIVEKETDSKRGENTERNSLASSPLVSCYQTFCLLNF